MLLKTKLLLKFKADFQNDVTQSSSVVPLSSIGKNYHQLFSKFWGNIQNKQTFFSDQKQHDVQC